MLYVCMSFFARVMVDFSLFGPLRFGGLGLRGVL